MLSVIIYLLRCSEVVRSPGPDDLADTYTKQKMKVNGPGTWRLGQGRNSWQWAKHAWLYSDPMKALKGEHLSALGSQQRGFLISASSVPHRRGGGIRVGTDLTPHQRDQMQQLREEGAEGIGERRTGIVTSRNIRNQNPQLPPTLDRNRDSQKHQKPESATSLDVRQES